MSRRPFRRAAIAAALAASLGSLRAASAVSAVSAAAVASDDPAFQVAPAAAAAPARDEGLAKGWKLEPIAPAADGRPALPEGDAEPFAKLLAPAGLRVVMPDGKPLCELWLRALAPAPAKPESSSAIQLPRLAQGTFVGAIRVIGAMKDYREQPVPAGLHWLRACLQPVDADHLGTSDSRDFLLVTSRDDDKDPKAIAAKDDLVALSKPLAPGDHPLALYLAAPPSADAAKGDAAKSPRAPRLFQRPEREELAIELELPTQAEGEKEPSPLRVALVVQGHAAH